MKKTPEPSRLRGCTVRLSLGELGSPAGSLEAVLLPLLHSGVAGEEPGLLEDGAHLVAVLEESPGNAVADGAGLAGNAAAGDGADDVEPAQGVGEIQGLADQKLQGLQAEVIIDVPVVNGDLAGAGVKTDTGDAALSAAGAVVVGLGLVHNFCSSFQLQLPGFGLLGGVAMLGPRVDTAPG